MEKERFLLNPVPQLSYRASSSPRVWQSSGLEVHGDMNSSSEALPSFLSLNWENSMDQSLPFQSALNSMQSSPAPADNIVIRKLIGRLGSICNNPGDISPQSQTLGISYINSGSNSCYSTPLNSPPKLDLGMDQSRGNMPILGNSLVTSQSLPQFAADPGFAQRAAKFSCFGGRNYSGLASQFGFQEAELAYGSMPPESGKLLRASSNPSPKGGAQASVLDNKEITTLSGPLQQEGSETEMRSVSGSDKKFNGLSRSSTPNVSETKFGDDGHEESPDSDQINAGELKAPNEMARKRKAAPRGKTKDLPSSPKSAKIDEEDELKIKKCKPKDAVIEKDEEKPKVEQNNGNSNAGDGSKMQAKDNPKPPEPPKQDYIHVRARRGQATDSHSLAERVRREKISERMKYLQDLVPGCNKVTGKAVMLDEIINYVQSLQRQVEFLSMKLATVNPRLDFNMDELLSKDIFQSRGPSPHMVYALDSSASSFSYGHQTQQGPIQNGISTGSETNCSVNPLELRRSLSMQLPTSDGYIDSASQLTTIWDDELHSLIQMGSAQNQETVFSSHASLPTAHTKIEL